VVQSDVTENHAEAVGRLIVAALNHAGNSARKALFLGKYSRGDTLELGNSSRYFQKLCESTGCLLNVFTARTVQLSE
jgi:hypothetical protein